MWSTFGDNMVTWFACSEQSTIFIFLFQRQSKNKFVNFIDNTPAYLHETLWILDFNFYNRYHSS